MQFINPKDHEGHKVHRAGQLFVCWTCNVHGNCGEQSKRKPYNLDAGYVASLRSGKDKGWVVIYKAKEQGLDDEGGKYAIVCHTHHTIVNVTNLPRAREVMKEPDFCEYCSGQLKEGE